VTSHIDVGIEFSFKGETHTLSATIDLDAAMANNGTLPDLHPLLARLNNIDTYSYLYEVMESHEIGFSNATGLAAEYLRDGVFDGDTFVRRWQEERQLAQLRPIARQHLNIDNLDHHPALQQALLEAYAAGRKSRP